MAAKRRWGTGPKVLTWIGAVLLALGVGAGVFGVLGFMNLLPFGIVTGEGEPGPDALGGGEVPGSAEVHAERGDVVVVWEVTPVGESPSLEWADTYVTGPSGEVRVSPAEVSGDVGVGGVDARTVAQFVAPETGAFTIDVGGEAHAFVVAQGDRLPGFVGNVLATVMLWFVTIFLSMIGFALLLAGIIWGTVRARRRPAAVMPQSPAPQPPAPGP